MKKSRLLFITNNYPPKTGGMEQYCFDFYNNIRKYVEIDKISNSKSRNFIPFFAMYALMKALIENKKYSAIHFGSGVLAPVGALLKALTGKKFYVTIHGLDITWPNKFYQNLICHSLKRADKIICVSNHTKDICLKKGLKKNKIIVINNGTNIPSGNEKTLGKQEWLKKYSINPRNKIIISVGRLIRRKGIDEVINNCFAKLKRDNYQYFIIGEGKEKNEIEKNITRHRLGKKIRLVGKIPPLDLKSFYKYSDFFLMPNIEITGDVEGFGIVCIEAGSWGLPVISSGIQGLRDSIIQGKTGLIYKNYLDLAGKLEDFLDGNLKFNSGKNIREKIKSRFSWNVIVKKYIKLYK